MMATDLHTQYAAELFNVPVAQVTPAMRRYAKLQRYVYAYSTPGKLGSVVHSQESIRKAYEGKR